MVRNISIKKSNIIIAVYLFLLFPLIIFLIGWLKFIIYIPVLLCLLSAFFFLVKKTINKYKNINIKLSISTFIFLIAASLLWSFISGQGGFYYQSTDYHWRNAIFRDLIMCDWPVIYNGINSALVYYIGFWLPSALIGKLFSSFLIGNICLFFWCSTGICLLFLSIISFLNIIRIKAVIFCIFFIVFFSGLDIIGTVINFYTVNNNRLLHLEWWADNLFQYSSNMTQMMWVFNQSLPAWLVTILYLNDKESNGYIIFIFGLSLLFSPIPAVGLIFVFLFCTIVKFFKEIKNKNIINYIKSFITKENFLSLPFILIILFYLMGSTQVKTNGLAFIFDKLPQEYTLISTLIWFILFYFFEVFIYILILFKDNKKDIQFISVVIFLFICPIISFGSQYDFCMRASIPPLFILMIYLIKYLKIHKEKILKSKLKIFLSIAISFLAFMTPFTEQYRAVSYIISANKINLTADDIKTFSDKSYEEYGNSFDNFLLRNPENTFFFKYLARK